MKPDKRDVLAAINDLRVELDLPPLDAIPRGTPQSSGKCPVARALFVDVLILQELPLVIYDFICAFDRGAYPELIEYES